MATNFTYAHFKRHIILTIIKVYPKAVSVIT